MTMQKERPILDLPKLPSENILDGLTLTGLAIGLGMLLFYYPGLPERLPIHFNAAGEPDGFGSKVTLLVLMGLAVAMSAGMWALARIPHKFNYPARVTAENAEAMYYKGRILLRLLNAGIVWIFTFLNWRTMEIAKGQADGLGTWFLIVVLIVSIGLPIYMTVQMSALEKK